MVIKNNPSKTINYNSNDQILDIEKEIDDITNYSKETDEKLPLRGIVIKFRLLKGCYATMAIREIMNEKIK